MKAKLGRRWIGTDVRYSAEHTCISNVMVMLCNALAHLYVCNSIYRKFVEYIYTHADTQTQRNTPTRKANKCILHTQKHYNDPHPGWKIRNAKLGRYINELRELHTTHLRTII